MSSFQGPLALIYLSAAFAIFVLRLATFAVIFARHEMQVEKSHETGQVSHGLSGHIDPPLLHVFSLGSLPDGQGVFL